MISSIKGLTFDQMLILRRAAASENGEVHFAPSITQRPTWRLLERLVKAGYLNHNDHAHDQIDKQAAIDDCIGWYVVTKEGRSAAKSELPLPRLPASQYSLLQQVRLGIINVTGVESQELPLKKGLLVVDDEDRKCLQVAWCLEKRGLLKSIDQYADRYPCYSFFEITNIGRRVAVALLNREVRRSKV